MNLCPERVWRWLPFSWGCLLLLAASAQAQQSSGPLLAPPPASAVSAQPAVGAIPATEQPPEASTNPEALEHRVQNLEAIVLPLRPQSGQGNTVPTAAWQQQLPADPVNFETASPPSTASAPSSIPSAQEGAVSNAFSQAFEGPFRGFFIESKDKAFSLRITGQLEADYREFLNTNDRTDIDTFLLRRARFGLEARLFQYYEFRFLPDFGQGTTIVQDAYMNIHYWDAFQAEIGKFKQPISYEELIQDRYVPTLERSLIDQLVPSRDLGAMIHGEDLCASRLDYAVSISNGEINGNSTDTNNHKDVDGRIAIRPWNSSDANSSDSSPWLRGLSVGVSGGFGVEQEAISPATLRMPDTVPFLSFNSTVRADGLRTRLSPELAYFNGPFGFFAQYYEQHQDIRAAATGAGYKHLIDVPFTGYVFLATLFLTGETRTTYSQQIFPVRPFDPRCPFSCPGAWELVGRVSRLDVGDVFEPGAAQLVNPAKYSNEAMEFAVGFNWYLNGWVRMQFNYEHDMFGQPVLLGSTPDNELKSQDSVFTRIQVIF